MQNNRHFDVFFQRFYSVVSFLRAHDAGHVFDADGLAAHSFHVFCQFHIGFQIVDGAFCVADCAGSDCAVFQRFVHSNLNVAHVVECVENTNDVNTVFNGLFHEHTNDIVGIMFISQKVLTAKQHLQFHVRAFCTDFAKPLPRIFVEVAQAGIKCCAAPALERIVTRFVHCFQDSLKIFKGKPCCNEGLIRVTKHSLSELDFHTHSLQI